MTRIRELIGLSWADLERPTECTVDGCRRAPHGFGLCDTHYERQRKHGSTDLVRPPTEVRFWGKVDKNGPVPVERPDLGPCWLWTGKRNWMGYGNIKIERRWWMSHRWAYHHTVAPVSAALELDHLCRVRPCVNPAHLEPVTSRENKVRGQGIAAKNARKTACLRGHDFTPENTGLIKGGTGGRYCKHCKRDANREWARVHRVLIAVGRAT